MNYTTNYTDTHRIVPFSEDNLGPSSSRVVGGGPDSSAEIVGVLDEKINWTGTIWEARFGKLNQSGRALLAIEIRKFSRNQLDGHGS